MRSILLSVLLNGTAVVPSLAILRGVFREFSNYAQTSASSENSRKTPLSPHVIVRISSRGKVAGLIRPLQPLICKRHRSPVKVFLAVESFCTKTVHSVRENTAEELNTVIFTMDFILNMPKSTTSFIIGSSSSESNATDPILGHG